VADYEFMTAVLALRPCSYFLLFYFRPLASWSLRDLVRPEVLLISMFNVRFWEDRCHRLFFRASCRLIPVLDAFPFWFTSSSFAAH